VRWLNVQDPNVSTLGLRAGDYDIIEGVPSIVADVEGAPGVVVNTDTPGLQLLQIGFNMNIPVNQLPEGDDIPADFFHDARVRQAFNYAFDYQAFINGPLSGAAGRGSFFIPQGMYGYDETAPIYDYDPQKAEELFKAAGWFGLGRRPSSGIPTPISWIPLTRRVAGGHLPVWARVTATPARSPA
jgi:peptide/nickel transport system substrate-binding protein